MTNKNVASQTRFVLMLALLICGIAAAGAPILVGPAGCILAENVGNSDAQLTSAIQNRLKGKDFQDVTVLVQDGTATLSGQVNLYAYKVEAIKKVKKTPGLKDVRDNIAVGGPMIPDAVLQRKLLGSIQVDRIGYGQVFDAISADVQNGVVTLGGHALGPVAEQSAVSLTEYTPGVKDVINQIRVDPVSQFDDGIRVRVYRAIYGFPALRRYAIVPAKPIRISVQNGRVTLYGIVDNTMDKQLAYTQAMGVPNVFQVTNDLIVANSEAQR